MYNLFLPDLEYGTFFSKLDKNTAYKALKGNI